MNTILLTSYNTIGDFMFYESRTTTIYYEKFGEGKKTIVILPGWGNTRETFYPLISEFQENYSIYILDYPGFGKSPALEEEWKMDDYAKLIKNFLWDLHIYNPIIIAHSFGGRITALLLGKYNIKVKKLILIDVAGIKRRKKIKVFLKEKLYKVLKKVSYLLPILKQEEFRQKLLIRFASTDYKDISRSMQKTFQNIIQEDLRTYYKKITAETLLIWGEKDLDTPLKDGKYLQKKIKNSALIIYPKANHFSYLNYPYLTTQIMKSFLEEK